MKTNWKPGDIITTKKWNNIISNLSCNYKIESGEYDELGCPTILYISAADLLNLTRNENYINRIIWVELYWHDDNEETHQLINLANNVECVQYNNPVIIEINYDGDLYYYYEGNDAYLHHLSHDEPNR